MNYCSCDKNLFVVLFAKDNGLKNSFSIISVYLSVYIFHFIIIFM